MNNRAIAGKFVTELFNFDGGREVTAYIPPDPPVAIIYSGDGQVISHWGKLIEGADLPATMIVGVHSLQNEELRLHEYSPGFAPEHFAKHQKFFVEDVRLWVQSGFGFNFSRKQTAIYGASAGGELALALGIRHPDLFGAILCASPGAGYQPPKLLPANIPSTYLVAGKQEPFFLDNAMRWANALTSAGIEVVMKVREGSHGEIFWQTEFPLMIAWAFNLRT